MQRTVRLGAMISVVVLLLGLVPGCSRDNGGATRDLGSGRGAKPAESRSEVDAANPKCMPVGDASTAQTKVEVALHEWAVAPAQPSAPAGTVHFRVQNTGQEPHEMVVVRGSDPSALPTKDDGSIDEDRLGEGALIGEVGPFPANGACDGTFTLSAGSYVLLCNVVEREESGELESHYKEGMRTTFTVN
jgi:hypothetical protein